MTYVVFEIWGAGLLNSFLTNLEFGMDFLFRLFIASGVSFSTSRSVNVFESETIFCIFLESGYFSFMGTF